jgi:hypothetical protein
MDERTGTQAPKIVTGKAISTNAWQRAVRGQENSNCPLCHALQPSAPEFVAKLIIGNNIMTTEIEPDCIFAGEASSIGGVGERS